VNVLVWTLTSSIASTEGRTPIDPITTLIVVHSIDLLVIHTSA